MGRNRILFILALGSCLRAESAAEPPKAPAEAGTTVTVTAEATPVEAAKTPNPVKVLDAEAIQRSGARTLEDLLPELLPGALTPYGGPGTAANLYLGGARAQDVVVVLDGIRITDPSSLGPNFSDFGLEGIERVEVLQGPSSTRYGSDTHGGVVALYSAAPAKAGLAGSAALAVGNRGLRRAQAAPAFGWDGGWAKLDVSASQEDQSIPADNPYRSTAAALNLGQRVGEDGMVSLTYRNFYRGTPLPFASGYDANWAFSRIFAASQYGTERHQDLVGSYRQTFGTAWLMELSFGHVSQDRTEPGMSVGTPYDPFHGQRNQAVLSLTWAPFRGFQGNLQLDHSGDEAAFQGQRASGLHDAAALEASYEWACGLRAVASGRYQKDAIERISKNNTALPDRDMDRFVYKAGLNWLSSSGLRLYASYGTSYNAPDLSRLTYNLAKSGATRDLDVETSHGFQAGASLARGNWTAKLEASRTLYDHVITWVNLPNWDGYYANGTDLRIQGLEGSLAYARSAWHLEAFARSQEARNTSQPEAKQFSTSGATGRPFFSGGLRGGAAFGDWRVDGRWTFVGSSYQYFDDYAGVEGARTHFNDLALSLGWSPWKPMTFTLRGEHLLQKAWSRQEWLSGDLLRKNDAYIIPVFPAQGPTATLEVKYRF